MCPDFVNADMQSVYITPMAVTPAKQCLMTSSPTPSIANALSFWDISDPRKPIELATILHFARAGCHQDIFMASLNPASAAQNIMSYPRVAAAGD